MTRLIPIGRMGYARRIGVVSLSLAGVLLVLGCDDSGTKPQPVPVPTSGPAKTAESEPPIPVVNTAALKMSDATPVQPWFAVGRVMMPDGKPISRPGVRIDIEVTGMQDETSRSATDRVEPQPGGLYLKRLKAGSYRPPTGRVEFPFNDKTYRLPLTPARDVGAYQDAREGVSQDFVWRLSGLRQGSTKDLTKPDCWIGGSIYAEYVGFRNDLGRNTHLAAPGTRVVFTLTPRGPLADGTEGQPIVIDRAYDATLTSLDNPVLPDLPLAFWQVSAVEKTPDGHTEKLLFQQVDHKWADQVEGTFEPDLSRAGLKQATIRFARRD